MRKRKAAQEICVFRCNSLYHMYIYYIYLELFRYDMTWHDTIWYIAIPYTDFGCRTSPRPQSPHPRPRWSDHPQAPPVEISIPFLVVSGCFGICLRYFWIFFWCFCWWWMALITVLGSVNWDEPSDWCWLQDGYNIDTEKYINKIHDTTTWPVEALKTQSLQHSMATWLFLAPPRTWNPRVACRCAWPAPETNHLDLHDSHLKVQKKVPTNDDWILEKSGK